MFSRTMPNIRRHRRSSVLRVYKHHSDVKASHVDQNSLLVEDTYVLMYSQLILFYTNNKQKFF
jgi:hypothetical protein